MYPQTTHTFESNKILAGVGALLAAIGNFTPFSGLIGIVHIVGIALVLIAIRGLADDNKDPNIFKRTFNGFIYSLISAAAFIAATALAIAPFTRGFFATHPIISVFAFIAGIAAWIVGAIFAIIAALNYRNAFDKLADKSSEPLHRTGGLILLIGAALSIIFVGFFVMFVAWIILAIGFFQLRLPTAQNQNAKPVEPQTSTIAGSDGQVKFCSFCGAENRLEATFCTHCGRRIETQTNPA
jgi:uncharacterized membrane protein